MLHQFFEWLLLEDWEHRTVTFNGVQKGHWTREGCTERPNPCSYCSQAVITTCSPFIMLESDMALKNDTAFLLLVQEYANDQAQWQSDFSTSWKQLTEAGLPGGCSRPEDERIEDEGDSERIADEPNAPLVAIICGVVVSLALCSCIWRHKQSEATLAKCVRNPNEGHCDSLAVHGEPVEEGHTLTLTQKLERRKETKQLLESMGEPTDELDFEIGQLLSKISCNKAAGPATASPIEPVATNLCEDVPPHPSSRSGRP